MNQKNLLLESLGYDEFVHNQAISYINDGFSPARVTEVNKGSFRVSDGLHEMLAELSGKYLYTAENSTDLPTVGDWVIIQALDNYSMAIIHDVLPRKTLLKRKEPGRKVDFQLIASNIDYGLILQSANSVNINSIERYLVMLNESSIIPLIVFSKIDLLSSSELTELQNQIKRLKNGNIYISNVTDQGTESLSNILQAGKTYCLLGASGAGKTSLLNRLLGENLYRVNQVREKDGKGKHTTVRRQLVTLPSGSIFIDTPGMRELGNFEIEEGLEQTFIDILLHETKCRYRDCSHTHESGCAIIEAVENGKIDSQSYQNYLKLRKESQHYEMSNWEKRKKERSLCKMIKNYNKHNRDE